MDAKHLHLGDIFDSQKLLARIIGKGFQLCIAVTIAGQAINNAEYIAKLVIEKWALHTLRQGIAHVTNFLAHGVPKIGHILWSRVVSQLKDDLRLSRLGVAADLVCVGYLLQGALNLVRHLLSH